jgi:hypothetical protein
VTVPEHGARLPDQLRPGTPPPTGGPTDHQEEHPMTSKRIIGMLATNRESAAAREQAVADKYAGNAAALRERGTGPVVEALIRNRSAVAAEHQASADRHRDAAAALRERERDS